VLDGLGLQMSEVAADIDGSQKAFLRASRDYDAVGQPLAMRVINRAKVYTRDDRPPPIRNAAQSFVRDLRDFGELHTSLKEAIAILRPQLQLTLLGMQTDELQAIVADLGRPTDLEDLRAMSARLSEGEARRAHTLARAVTLGRTAVSAQRIAAVVVDLRQLTLEEFCREKLSRTWADIKGELELGARDAAVAAALEGGVKVLEAVLLSAFNVTVPAIGIVVSAGAALVERLLARPTNTPPLDELDRILWFGENETRPGNETARADIQHINAITDLLAET
jgi:hypothetical protein